MNKATFNMPIIINNILKGKSERGKEYCRISFVLNDEDLMQESQNFKGYPEIVQFCNKGFDEITKNDIGVSVIGTFELKTDFKNPLNTKQVLVSIDTDDKTINLL